MKQIHQDKEKGRFRQGVILCKKDASFWEQDSNWW